MSKTGGVENTTKSGLLICGGLGFVVDWGVKGATRLSAGKPTHRGQLLYTLAPSRRLTDAQCIILPSSYSTGNSVGLRAPSRLERIAKRYVREADEAPRTPKYLLIRE